MNRAASTGSFHWLALAAAVLVTLLWASSYILNQFAFAEGIGPFTLAGMRYSTAAITLWVFRYCSHLARSRRGCGETNLLGASRLKSAASERLVAASAPKDHTQASSARGRLTLSHFLLLGISGYLLAQGLQYIGQWYVTPTQTSMILAVGNTVALVLLDSVWLREIKGASARFGILAAVIGIVWYYYPWNFIKGSWTGIGLILVSSIGYAVHLALSRHLLASRNVKSGDLVLIPMTIGAIGMLAAGFALEGMPPISLQLVGIVLWLGTVNGAAAFSLWAWSQKRLRAYESGLLNNLILLEVALLDVLVLHRTLTGTQLAGLLLAGLAIAFVQLAPHFAIRLK